MAAMTFRSTLLEKIPRLPDTTSFRFSRPPDYTFQAGQFFTITLHSPDGPLTHAFSHCDSPTETWVELTTRLTGSPFKNALDSLPVGSEAEIEGPWGQFLFKYHEPRLAFLTGGVGLTPVRSMLRYLADTGGAGRVAGQQIVLIYGSMTEEGILYRDEVEAYARALDGVRVVHVITKPGPSWQGYSGFITSDVVKAELGDPLDWKYYIVGPPPMIDAMWKVMDALSVPKDSVAVEGFAGYAS
jgi:glycine betaine catabolism B